MVRNSKQRIYLKLNLKDVQAYGTYISGWYSVLVYGWAVARRAHLSRNARAELSFSIQLFHHDSSVFYTDKSLWIKNPVLFAPYKGQYKDLSSGVSTPKHSSDLDFFYTMNSVVQEGNGSKDNNLHTPFIQFHLLKIYEAYQLSITEAAQRIVSELENS